MTTMPFSLGKDKNQGVYLSHLSHQDAQFLLDDVINLQKDDLFLLKGGVGLLLRAPFLLVGGIHQGMLDLL